MRGEWFFFACGRRMDWTVGWRAKIFFFLKKVNGGKEMKRIDSGREGEKGNGWILDGRDESRGKMQGGMKEW